MTVDRLLSSAVAATDESIAALATRFNHSIETIRSIYGCELAELTAQSRIKDYVVLLTLRSVRDQLSNGALAAVPR